MTIVELIDAHDGFELVTSRITTTSRRKLLVTIVVLSFFLSAVLDNLTTSIVMMSLVRKLASDELDRRYYAGIVIIAANSGGVWSPIGDVTTTMLWVGGQVTTPALIWQLFVPAVVSVAFTGIVFLIWKDCSPCRIITGFTSTAALMPIRAGNAGMTANVGSTCRFRS